MAISTYSELQTAIADYLIRDDLASVIPQFIEQAEASLNRLINNRRQETSATLTMTAGTATLAMPVDLLEVRGLTITDGLASSLDVADLAYLSRFGTATGRPRFYCVSGSNFRFGPIPDADYEVEIVYKQRIPTLSISAPANWLLSSHPDIYLMASLIEANTYLASDSRTPLFAEKLAVALKSLEDADLRASWQSGPIQSRVDFDVI